MTVIHWFRRDLRLDDNLALRAAAAEQPVVPVFIFDPAILGGRYFGLPRLGFMLKALRALDDSLRARGSRLFVYRGDPRHLLPRLAAQLGAAAVYVNRDYTPYYMRAQKGRGIG